MENRSNHVLVGAVVLALLVAVLGFVLWLSQGTGEKKKEYDIFFGTAVDGLLRGSAVTFSGVPVGEIKSINLEPRTPQFIRVRISVEETAPILIGTTATINSVGFTGPTQIQLEPAEREKGKTPSSRPIICPERNVESQCPYGVPVIPTKAGGLGALLNTAPELLERVSALTARLTELLGDRNQESIAGILANTQVISSNLAARSDEIAATMAEAQTAIRQTGVAVERMGQLADTSNSILQQDTKPLINDLRHTVRAAEASMKNLDAAVTDVRPGLQAFSKQTIPEIGQLTRDLREMSDALSSVAQRLDQQGVGGIIGGQTLPDYKAKK